MRFSIIIIFSILILNCLPAIHAQEFENVKFDRLKSENVKLIKGLSQNWIYDILQDRYGYMWFGTWDGLNKYDGYNFTIYNVDEGLSDHIVYSLLEDDEGILWIGTDKGFNKFDRNTLNSPVSGFNLLIPPPDVPTHIFPVLSS